MVSNIFNIVFYVQPAWFNDLIGFTGENALPPEEETLLLDNYDSDCEDEWKPDSDNSSDQGCLKVMLEGGIAH